MASGDTLLKFEALGGIPPASNAATIDEITATTGIRLVLDFDQAVDETILWQDIMPAHYGGGGLTIEIWGAMDTANTTDSVVLDAALERVEAGVDLGGANDFAAVNSVTQVANDTQDALFKSTITFTNGADMDSVVADDAFRFKLTRDANNASDTAAGDFQLLAIHVKET